MSNKIKEDKKIFSDEFNRREKTAQRHTPLYSVSLIESAAKAGFFKLKQLCFCPFQLSISRLLPDAKYLSALVLLPP